MKILTWNCGMKFREKYYLLKSFELDIAIIQECENPDEIKYPEEFIKNMTYYLWVGDNKSKGLGIFSKIPLEKNNWSLGENKYFISCKLKNCEFNIVGVWCKKHTIAS